MGAKRSELRRLIHPCGKCGAAAGQECRDYKGRNKAPCRFIIPPALRGETRAREVVQRALFDHMNDEGSKL